MTMYTLIAQGVLEWLLKQPCGPVSCMVKLRLYDNVDHEEYQDITALMIIINGDDDEVEGYWYGNWWSGQKRVDILGITPLNEVSIQENYRAVFVLD